MQQKRSAKCSGTEQALKNGICFFFGIHSCWCQLRYSRCWAPRCETERHFNPKGKQMSHRLHFPIAESWGQQLVGGRPQSECGGGPIPQCPFPSLYTVWGFLPPSEALLTIDTRQLGLSRTLFLQKWGLGATDTGKKRPYFSGAQNPAGKIGSVRKQLPLKAEQ